MVDGRLGDIYKMTSNTVVVTIPVDPNGHASRTRRASVINRPASNARPVRTEARMRHVYAAHASSFDGGTSSPTDILNFLTYTPAHPDRYAHTSDLTDLAAALTAAKQSS